MPRGRDSQRAKVYRWEGDALVGRLCGLASQTLDLEACAALVERAWHDYWPGCPPQLRDGRGCRRAWGNHLEIALPRWARTERVVLHETTHALLYKLAAVSDHGPEFVRLYIDLLARYHYPKVPKATLLASARAASLKIARIAACPQPERGVTHRPRPASISTERGDAT